MTKYRKNTAVTADESEPENINDITKVIKRVFAEEFKKQENFILQTISSNFLIHTERLDGLVKEINSIKESLEFQQAKVDKEVSELKKEVIDMQQQLHEVILQDSSESIKSLQAKIDDMEDRSRRNNIRVDGIVDGKSESWEESERKVKNLLSDRMGIDVHIERAHRTGTFNKNKQRTIVCRLYDYKQKEHIVRNARTLKGTNVFINEDFCKNTTQIRKELWGTVKRNREEGKISYINYRTIICKPMT